MAWSNQNRQHWPSLHNETVRLILLAAYQCLLAALLQAEEPVVRKFNYSRLWFSPADQRAYLTTKNDPRTRRLVDYKPFTGVAFVEESWGRAEMTYSNGILHGPVVIMVDNKVLSQFEYVNGKRVLNGMSAEEREKENKAVAESKPEGTEGSIGESTPQIYRPPIPRPDGGGQ